jgi:hypothetical protein
MCERSLAISLLLQPAVQCVLHQPAMPTAHAATVAEEYKVIYTAGQMLVDMHTLN